MTNDDGLPVETTSWYKILEDLCKGLGENINLLICDGDVEQLHKEFAKGESNPLVAWTPRYVFKSVIIDKEEAIVYVPRNPTRVH